MSGWNIIATPALGSDVTSLRHAGMYYTLPPGHDSDTTSIVLAFSSDSTKMSGLVHAIKRLNSLPLLATPSTFQPTHLIMGRECR